MSTPVLFYFACAGVCFVLLLRQELWLWRWHREEHAGLGTKAFRVWVLAILSVPWPAVLAVWLGAWILARRGDEV